MASHNDHQLAAFRDPTPHPLAGPEGQGGYFDLRKATCRLIVDDGLSQKIATIAGAGISVKARWSIHEEIAGSRLVRAMPDFEIADRCMLWLVDPNANILSTKVRVFMDFLLDRIGRSPIWDRD